MRKHGKIVLVGCGAVGTSFLYSAINQGLAQEYILIDVFKDAADGNALDLADTLAVLPKPFVSIKSGEYSDCKDADVVVITAGRPQKVGETRLAMVADNARIMKEIAEQIKKSGFEGITIIASNPVDVLTLVYQEVTKFDPKKVIGSGTTLDSARLRRLVAAELNVSPTSLETYLMGEHGDSSVAVWSRSTIMGQPLLKFIEQTDKKVLANLTNLRNDAVQMAYKIIEKKRATFYGIGACLSRILQAILENQSTTLMVGAKLNGEYGEEDLYTGVPAIINNEGWSKIIEWELTPEEKEQFKKSCATLKETIAEARKAIK